MGIHQQIQLKLHQVHGIADSDHRMQVSRNLLFCYNLGICVTIYKWHKCQN